jgi:hypothetical protein
MPQIEADPEPGRSGRQIVNAGQRYPSHLDTALSVRDACYQSFLGCPGNVCAAVRNGAWRKLVRRVAGEMVAARKQQALFEALPAKDSPLSRGPFLKL